MSQQLFKNQESVSLSLFVTAIANSATVQSSRTNLTPSNIKTNTQNSHASFMPSIKARAPQSLNLSKKSVITMGAMSASASDYA
jgi:hypothetical protein